MSGFNPNASEWKPSAAAKPWTPSAMAAAPVAPPVPEPAPTNNNMDVDGEDNDQLDESDPLWVAVMKVTGGDRERARKMIEDPDSLTQYPEVAAVLEADWEKDAADDGNNDDGQNLAQDLDQKMAISEAEAPKVVEKQSPPPITTKKSTDSDMADASPKAPVKEGDPREHVNLVFIGHVDAGKSTLSGNILYLTENVDKRTIERYEREAKELNRESWFLAFIMDTNDEERAKGKTVEVGRAHFDTNLKRYTILDAPGHKNYVPNMIMGASQADVGILVISARRGEFETGFDRGGQTREHAMLAKTLGVTYLIVVINKMDDPTVKWAKSRFDECVSKLKPFLAKLCKYVIKKEVKFIPISGLNGANVKNEVDPKDCPWWKGCYESGENFTKAPTLLDLLDTLEMKDRNPEAAVRIPVLGRYNDRGTIAMGKVESGTIRPGMKVTLMPTRNEYKVDSVWANEDAVDAARPGENVLVKLGGGCGLEDVQKGFVICTPPACRAVDKMICDIALLDLPENASIFTAGLSCIFHCHTCEEECVISKLFETTWKGVTNKKAQFAKVGMRIKCMLALQRTVPVETFAEGPFLGRFTLRTEGKTIAIGRIEKLPPKKE